MISTYSSGYFNGFEVLEVTAVLATTPSTPTTCFRRDAWRGRGGHLDGESFNPERTATIAPMRDAERIERMHLTLGLGQYTVEAGA
jgi:hypothetical protein